MIAGKRGRIIMLEVTMVIISLIVIIPLLVMLLGSFKTAQEASYFNLKLPSEWHFDNYKKVFEDGKLDIALMNSTIITVMSSCITVISSALAAFTISRKKGKAYNALFALFSLGMIAPFMVVPTISLLKLLDLSGTYSGVILVSIATSVPWSVMIFTGFIKGVPREMDEAAIIDGCGPYKMFFKVILPLLQPVLVTNLLIITVGVWNEFMIPLYLFNSASQTTMPLTVYNFFGQYANQWNLVFADLVMTALPVTLLYILFQRYIVAGLTSGAVKG